MCLGVPGEIVELKSSVEAVVDFWGMRKCIRLDNLASPAGVGDFIIDHAGYAVRVIPPDDVAGTLALYGMIFAENGEDPTVRDVVDELECTTEIELEQPTCA